MGWDIFQANIDKPPLMLLDNLSKVSLLKENVYLLRTFKDLCAQSWDAMLVIGNAGRETTCTRFCEGAR